MQNADTKKGGKFLVRQLSNWSKSSDCFDFIPLEFFILLEFSSQNIPQIWRFVVFIFSVKTARDITVARHRLDLHDHNPQVSLLLSPPAGSESPTEHFILQEVTQQEERKTTKQSPKIHNINKPDQLEIQHVWMLFFKVAYYFINFQLTDTQFSSVIRLDMGSE